MTLEEIYLATAAEFAALGLEDCQCVTHPEFRRALQAKSAIVEQNLSFATNECIEQIITGLGRLMQANFATYQKTRATKEDQQSFHELGIVCDPATIGLLRILELRNSNRN